MLYIIGISTQDVLCVWLRFINILFLRFIHVVACGCSSSLLLNSITLREYAIINLSCFWWIFGWFSMCLLWRLLTKTFQCIFILNTCTHCPLIAQSEHMHINLYLLSTELSFSNYLTCTMCVSAMPICTDLETIPSSPMKTHRWQQKTPLPWQWCFWVVHIQT